MSKVQLNQKEQHFANTREQAEEELPEFEDPFADKKDVHDEDLPYLTE